MTPQNRLALKLRLERALVADLTLFAKLYLDAWAETKTRGGILPRMTWVDKASEVLVQHYVRVIRSIEDGRIFETSERLEQVTSPDVSAKLYDKARLQGQLIVDRIDADLAQFEVEAPANQQSVRMKATAFDLELKKRSGWSVVVISSLKQTWAKLKTRIPVWSNINTQDVAEEAVPRATIVPEDQAETVVKRWITMQDEKVRAAHAAAHGQTVRVDEPFTVGGERLRHPGDTGLGASLGNVINCRCVAEYGVMRDGQFVSFDVTTARGEARAPRRPGTKPGSAAPRLPTQSFTFGYGKGPWRGRVVLTNGESANYTVRDGGITIRVGRQAIASARVTRDTFGKWTLGDVSIAAGRTDAAQLQTLLRQSVEWSNRLKRP